MTQPIDTAYVEVLPDFSKFENALRRDLKVALTRLEHDVKQAFDNIEDAAAKAGRRIAIDISLGAEIATRAVDHFADSAERDLDRVGRSAGKAARKIQESAFASIVGSIGDAIANLVSGLGSIATSSPLLVLILALLPAIIGLGSALADLVGLLALLPAGFSVTLASIIPLVLAFQNFGDAVSAVLAGDPDKIAEAFKKLAPAAQSVAKEIGVLAPAFRELAKSAQEAFFTPLIGALTDFSKAVLPTLNAGVAQVAHAFGVLGENVLGILALPENVKLLNNLFATTAGLVANMSFGLESFISGFLKAANAGLPAFAQLSNALFGAVGNFGEFLEKAAESGDLAKFIDKAIQTVKELFDLLKATAGLIGTLFEGTNEQGHGLIVTLTDVINRLNAFLKTAEGQEELKAFADLIIYTGKAIGFAVNYLITVIKYINFARHTFSDFVQNVDNVGKKLHHLFDELGNFISGIPAKIGEFLSALPGQIVSAFKSAFDQVLVTVGIAIGAIIFELVTLPGLILDEIKKLPGQIVDALTELGPKVGNVLETAFEAAKQLVISKWDEIVSFVKSVPDRIAEIGPRMLAAGKDLLTMFGKGLQAAGNFLGNIAGNIGDAIKGFLNHTIDKINEGIAKVDDKLPGDLPRIPRLASGGIVPATPGGQLVVAGEGGEDEVVAPLSKLQGLGGTQITFGPGSISVSFEGAVPTADQAMTTGMAIGEGIIASLTRRNIRTTARAA